jgi:hypothetical protein
LKLKCRLKIAKITRASAWRRNTALWTPVGCHWCAFEIR